MKKRKPHRRHRRSHGHKGGHRRRHKKGMPSWAIFGLELLGGALIGTVLGPIFPEAISGEAVVLGALAVGDKHRRELLAVSSVAMEALMLAAHSKPVQEATAKVALLSSSVKEKVGGGKGGGAMKNAGVTIDQNTAANVVKNVAGAAKLAAVVGL